MAPAGRHGVLNDAIAIYFNDATLASSYVARWRRLQSREHRRCLQIRGVAPALRTLPSLHKPLTVVAARGACTGSVAEMKDASRLPRVTAVAERLRHV